MSNPKFKTELWREKYEPVEGENVLGQGGNSTVIKVRNKETKDLYALKPLSSSAAKNNKDPEKRERFKNEIKIVVKNHYKIQGIIPIIDYYINDTEKEYWYTMPIAKDIKSEIASHSDYSFIINGVIELANTLCELHKIDISHRDIKPANIYYHTDRFCLGDFGLANFIEADLDLTKSDKALGAMSTMAPEMRRNPKEADGKKADVYSLAKTLWIMLTNNDLGFDGVYDYSDPKISLRYVRKLSKLHLVELEELLNISTDNDPEKRPTMQDFKDKLKVWLDMEPDKINSEEVQISEWHFINKLLFGKNDFVPETAIWYDYDKILVLLKQISKLPALNHMLYDRGGLDLVDVEKANEEGCIYLLTGNEGYSYGCDVISPQKVIFENFNGNERWNYFIIELNNLEPVAEKTYSLEYHRETLVEDLPGHYVYVSYPQYGVYDYDTGEKFPDGWRVVDRWLNGKFLICLKLGPYNSINTTYDGRHFQCSAIEFRNYINELIKKCSLHKEWCRKNHQKYNEEVFLNQKEISKNPFVISETPMPVNSDEKKSKKRENENKFLKDSFSVWNFLKECVYQEEDCKTNRTRYRIVYDKGAFDSRYLLNREKYFFCVDGCFKLKVDESDIMIFYSINDVICSEEKIKESILFKCKQNGYDIPQYEIKTFIEADYESIKPCHLFTKDEIKKAMSEADDRVENTLVVDENGYVKIIANTNSAKLYPVCFETWDAGNMYVGKYSNLNTLDRDYIMALQGWLSFLKSKKHQKMEYEHVNNDIDNLISEIEKYY